MSIVATKLESSQDLEEYRRQVRDRASRVDCVVRVCCGPGCLPKGAGSVYEGFVAAAKEADEKSVTVSPKLTGCQGLCECGPIVTIDPGGIFYQGVRPDDVAEIWSESVLGGRVVERLLYHDKTTGKTARTADEIPFYQGHHRIALALCGVADARSIDDYIGAGGYAALAKVLASMAPEDVIGEVTRSGLRGRGGGGFLTGKKWRSARDAPGRPKYVIANGDEGDPGAFMDRALMEGVPHAVIEGIIIGGYAIGSSAGYIYVRNEYPIAVERLKDAVFQAREMGLLGEDILGSGFDFDIRINRGGGAFVCGESTALMASLEGRVGEPRAKYIHTVEAGFHGKPSLLNNVETWANVSPIILHGADWFAALGTPKSKGTKVFSLVGRVKNTGLIEVPMGMTLRRIIYDIGGGIRDGKPFKAVQTGGPSGGCIPAEYLDEPVDFDRLTELGSMMGSGGMIVMDEDTCMVNVARYFLRFLKDESCGKCTPCREGLAQMLHILDGIAAGQGRPGDLERLEQLAVLLEDTALCALGKTAANPVLSTLRYFRSEYQTHIEEKRCPAKECRGLFRYEIDAEACTGCGVCRKKCPVEAIAGQRKKPHLIDAEICTNCGTCFDVCRFGAVKKV
jgi:NADH:ubiquinone oxidoreductase subunit F (NADH-binding)/(2Fe-2S) ferredoxin/Pyruvate/2-oxoacid:ferredoxin oxidoreductase delta subunit